MVCSSLGLCVERRLLNWMGHLARSTDGSAMQCRHLPLVLSQVSNGDIVCEARKLMSGPGRSIPACSACCRPLIPFITWPGGGVDPKFGVWASLY